MAGRVGRGLLVSIGIIPKHDKGREGLKKTGIYSVDPRDKVRGMFGIWKSLH
jgi:hypothetical protein